MHRTNPVPWVVESILSTVPTSTDRSPGLVELRPYPPRHPYPWCTWSAFKHACIRVQIKIPANPSPHTVASVTMTPSTCTRHLSGPVNGRVQVHCMHANGHCVLTARARPRAAKGKHFHFHCRGLGESETGKSFYSLHIPSFRAGCIIHRIWRRFTFARKGTATCTWTVQALAGRQSRRQPCPAGVPTCAVRRPQAHPVPTP